MKSARQRALLPWVLLILLSLVWGSSFTLIRRSLLFFEAPEVGMLRVFFAFVVMSVFAVPNIRKIPRDKWKYLLVSGFIGSFLPAYLFAEAQTQIPGSIAGILNSLTPVFTFILGLLFFGMKAKKGQFPGLLLAFSGAVWLSVMKSDGSVGSLNLYALLIIVATVCYALSTNVVKTKLGEVRPLLISAMSFLLVAPFALAYLIFEGTFTRVDNSPEAIEAVTAVIFLGIFGTGLALVLFYKIVSLTSPVFAVSVTYLIPIVAFIWGIADNERIAPVQYLGMILILIGVYWLNRSGVRAAKKNGEE